MNKIKLYAKDAVGNLRIWTIEQDAQNHIEIKHGVYGGTLQTESETIDYGIGGRSQQEQIESRMQSRINKKVDLGYVFTADGAMNEPRTNSLGFMKPMLAARYDKVKDFKFEHNYVQKKLDGHRCLITKRHGEVVAYSRNGKLIDTIKHILEELQDMPEGTTLDGELYHHGTKLQRISSWVKKYQVNTKSLKFVCYDVMEDHPYKERYETICDIIPHDALNSRVIETDIIYGEFPVAALLGSSLRDGYEGLILRPAFGFNYEDGKRSKGLIKVKAWLDDEYRVTGVTASVDGYGVLHMQHNKKYFKATAPGTMPEKRHVLENAEQYIGKMVNIQYAFLTEDGVPFQPIATMWRDKNAE